MYIFAVAWESDCVINIIDNVIIIILTLLVLWLFI